MTSGRTSSSQWRATRARVIRAQPYVCYWCGCRLDPAAKRGEPGAIEIDHIDPVRIAPGREYDMSNLVLSCRPCNRTKGARTATASVMRRAPLAR